MGVAGKNHCDFFVYTHWNSSGKNYTQSRNLEKYSSDIATFWYKYLTPEILLQKLQNPPESITLHDQAQVQRDQKHKPKK